LTFPEGGVMTTDDRNMTLRGQKGGQAAKASKKLNHGSACEAMMAIIKEQNLTTKEAYAILEGQDPKKATSFMGWARQG